jgi:hypothetical protein
VLGFGRNNDVTDRHGRSYVGLFIEIEPGYDRFVQSADPAIQEQMLSAEPGDLVRVVGVVKGASKGNSNGTSIRVLTYTVVTPVATGPQLVAEPSELAVA